MVDFGSDLRKRTLVLCAAFAFAIAASVLLRGRIRKAQVLFALFAGDIALWYLAQALYGFFQAEIWARFTALLSVALPQVAIHLFEAVLPTKGEKKPALPRVAGFLAVPVIALVVSPYYGLGLARGVVFVYVVGLVVASLVSLAGRGWTNPSRATQRRVRYLLVTGGLATTFSFADFLWFIGTELPPVGSVLSTIFLFALAQSLARERLLDLYELFGRLMVSTLLAFVLAGIFYVCVTLIGGFSTMYLNAVLAAVVILVLFEPMRQKVEEKIHQLFFRERFDLESAIQRAKGRLLHALDVDEIKDAVLPALENSRRVTAGAIYLRDNDGTAFDLAGSFGADAPLRVELARGLQERVVERGSIVAQELGREQAEGRGSPDHERLIASTAVLGPLHEGVLVGVRAEGELLGLLVVHDERVRDAFSPDDVTLLESLAAQLGVALENSRVYARMKAKDRLAALGQMAAGLAHEIKNPLGAIKGAAQLLNDPAPGAAPLDAPNQEFLAIILEEVDRLDRVVRSVLDYARPSSDDPAAIDVNAVVRRTTQILGSAGDEGTIELALADDLPLARIDAEKLRQVLMNLVQNAVQAMDGSGVVRVITRSRPSPPTWSGSASGTPGETRAIEIAVRDTGPGISKKVLKNLFVPFFTTKDTGTGLGLAISQRIVQTAGGSIEVDTQEGAGTTFTIVLPAVRDADASPLGVVLTATDDREAATRSA